MSCGLRLLLRALDFASVEDMGMVLESGELAGGNLSRTDEDSQDHLGGYGSSHVGGAAWGSLAGGPNAPNKRGVKFADRDNVGGGFSSSSLVAPLFSGLAGTTGRSFAARALTGTGTSGAHTAGPLHQTRTAAQKEALQARFSDLVLTLFRPEIGGADLYSRILTSIPPRVHEFVWSF